MDSGFCRNDGKWPNPDSPVGFVKGNLQETIIWKNSFYTSYTYRLNIVNCYVY